MREQDYGAMANTTRLRPVAGAVRDRAHYAGWIGRVMRSRAYANTIGHLGAHRAVQFAALSLVPIVWILLMNVAPILQMLHISLMAEYPHPADRPVSYTLANYEAFFSDRLYFIPFIRSVVMATLVTAVTLVIVFPIAYYVAKIVKPANRMRALLLLLIPLWAGELIRMISIVMLLANRGALNYALRELGLIHRPIPMLYTTFSLSYGIVYLLALYMLLPLFSAFEKIPPQLINAAADLGANPWQRFWRVILPLSKDGIVSGCSLVYLASVGAYTAPLLLGGPSTVIFPEVVSTMFYTSSASWPVGAAFAIIMLVTSLFTAGLFMRVVGGRAVRTI